MDKLPPLERYFKIFEVLSAFPDGLTLSELATVLVLPKGSTHRLLATMQKSALVTPGPDGATYVLGARVRRLGVLATGSDYVAQLTAAHLRELSANTGETCYVARLEGTRVRAIAMDSPDTPWRGFVLPGKIMHPHATASAKAIVAFQDDALIDTMLAGELPQLAPCTKTAVHEVKREFAAIRQNGYATCIGEVDDGLAAVAVPIEVAHAGVQYSLGIVGPRTRIVTLIEDDIMASLRPVARAIAAFLSKGATLAAIDDGPVP